MSTGSSVNLSSLYLELIRAGENAEFDKALKIVNKILHENKEDIKAQHCKAVCLIHLSQFEEAIKLLEKYVPEAQFEKAYCFYRLNKISDAYKTLKAVTNPGWKEKELLAQVLYRMENYEECFEAYKELIKNSTDDFEEERETNLSAVISNLYAEKGKEFKAPELREHTYELCYNSACILINKNEYSAAIDKLKVAEDLCKETLQENDATEEEIEAELGVIRVQHGYTLQLQGKNDRALKIYNQILKNKPSDVAVAAIASNNIVTLNKDQNVFDSKKKMKTATAENLDSKLTSKQLQTIAVNNCLLLLHTNQTEQCRKSIQELIKRYPSKAADAALLQAALFCKEKKVQKAVNTLKDFAQKHPEQSIILSFTLTQLLLTQGHISQACDTLRSIGDVSYTPGVVSALVTLYTNMENRDAALNILHEAIAWYRKNRPKNNSLNLLIQETAKMELKNGNPQEAAKLLEELHLENENDQKILAQLISAYSQFDPEKAKQISRKLHPISEVTLNIDVDNLESTSWTMGAKYIKKGKSDIPSGKLDTGSDLIATKKKRKHKKGKLPKNYNPNVDPDPERWLPRRERSTYKKKKDKRGTAIGKGTQGAIVSGSEENTKLNLSSNVPSPGTSVTPTSPNVQGPRQVKGGQKRRKKIRW